MFFDFENDNNNYFQENFSPNDNIVKIPEFIISENFCNEEQKNFSNIFINKDIDSETIQYDYYLIPKNSNINQNNSNILNIEKKIEPIENDLKLKTEISVKGSPSSNTIFNTAISNLNEKKKNQNKKKNII